MRHIDLVEKYNKAQRHFKKGNYIRARTLFRKILFEMEVSDSDSMGDFEIYDYTIQYLEEIQQKGIKIYKGCLIYFILIFISLIIYFILK